MPRNMAEKFSKKPMMLDGETLRPKSTLPKIAPGDEHSAVPIWAILSFSGRADEAVELKPSGRSNAKYAPKESYDLAVLCRNPDVDKVYHWHRAMFYVAQCYLVYFYLYSIDLLVEF